MYGGFLTRWNNSGRRRGRKPGFSSHYAGVASNPFKYGSWGEHNSFSSPTLYKPTPPKPPGMPPNGNPGPIPPGNPQRPPNYFSNLENNLPLPQGWQREYAQPTSISSLITKLLYQSRQDPNDFWNKMLGTQSPYGGTGYKQSNPYGQSYYGGNYSSSTRSSKYNQQNGMYQSTQDALSLADAYFAPKRLELAYELGDMETDMRRLSVNLGRQVDDPMLQAKLYKEAMRSVRTIDSEQNTFAIQMVEQRRKEEMQNTQFYDQLSLERDKMELQDAQHRDQMRLQYKQLSMQQSNQAGGASGY